MDLKQLKEIMKREGARAIIVEDGEPILVVSLLEQEQRQISFRSSSRVEAKKNEEEKNEEEKNEPSFLQESGSEKTEDKKTILGEAVKTQEISQGTELLTKEELPSDELTVEDLPF